MTANSVLPFRRRTTYLQACQQAGISVPDAIDDEAALKRIVATHKRRGTLPIDLGQHNAAIAAHVDAVARDRAMLVQRLDAILEAFGDTTTLKGVSFLRHIMFETNVSATDARELFRIVGRDALAAKASDGEQR